MTRSAVTMQDEAIPGSGWVGLGASSLPQWLTGIGCLILSLPFIGWMLDVPVLRGFGDPGYAVAPLSAINGCLITLSGFLAVSGRPRLARIAIAPAVLLLSLIVLEYLTGAVAVERWFFFEDVQRLGVRNNGLSPGGTVAVAAIGALAAVAITFERKIHRVIAIILSSASIALTLLATTALIAESGGTSPAFLGRSAVSSAVALLPAAGVILYAMRRRDGEQGWHLLVRLAPAIIILPAIPSLMGFAAYQMHLLGYSAAQFLVLAGNVLILAWVLMRAIRHADGQARALAIREAKLSAVLAMVPDAVMLIEENGTIVEFSAAAERLWGYRAEEVLGKPVTMLAPEEHAERYQGELAALGGREPNPWSAEPLSAVGRRSDGSLFPLEARAGRVQADDVRCLTLFVRDMSMQFGAEDQVAQLNAELAHLARQSAMGEAAADLAHELNQPLTAAANYLSAATMLARNTGAEGPGTELVGNAREQVMHAGDIIRRLRSFTERNDTERSVEPLQPMIEDAARLVLVGSSRLAAQFDYDVEPAGLSVFVDRVQVQQVLVNLMRNAVEALRDSGQPAPRIWITARPTEDAMVEIRCRDNGPGLPPETLAQLFQRFSANGSSDGMGIGLSISKRIVELHGGVFSASNAPQGGAEFVFTLPTLENAEIGAA
ncbi:ATP-binding protein [Sphingomonas sp. HITSZ_GF]|uniref:sensor histidine kinase n=1 Tax=Sphingomonas sp. HITSZ_GF TaxID=3037247 RepID=UPI00240CF224|nr:ATP-binding protein [Sphingomonas sp. HITSZ_GF]MDG2532372.1 ATP-binding protein [Sphingomonas sp. HITSZ_GF]